MIRGALRDQLRITPSTVAVVAWTALSIGLSLAFIDVAVGPWDHDGGFFLLHSAYIADGLRPYIDYSSIYPPVVEILSAGVVALMRDRLIAALLIPSLWIAANTIATGVLVFKASGDRAVAALVAAIFPLYAIENGGNHLTLELGVSLFSLAAFAMLVSDAPMLKGRLVMAGLFASAAVLSKQTGAIALLPMIALLYPRRSELTSKGMGALIGGTMAIPAAILVWLRFDVAAVLRSTAGKVAAYATSPMTSPDLLHNEANRAPASVALFCVVAIASIALLIRAPRLRLLVALTFACGVIEFLPRYIRDYPHYNLNIWPFAALILALAAAERDPWVHFFARAALLTFVGCAFGLFLQQHAVLEPSPLLTTFRPAALLVEMATPERDGVRQYGTEPIIEFLALRREEKPMKTDRALYIPDDLSLYSAPPSSGTTVVIVNRGQSWVEPLLKDLRAQGFFVIGRVGSDPSVCVLRGRG